MSNSVVKRCDCGHSQRIELTDEILDELDMNGYAVVYCEDCGNDLDVNSEDLGNTKSSRKVEYGVYELSDDYEDIEEDDY